MGVYDLRDIFRTEMNTKAYEFGEYRTIKM